jgi:tetratricopeptide (TPR) repeat protein
MKTKYGVVAFALLINMAIFAQKDELKAAEKAMKNGNPIEARDILEKSESLFAGAEDAQKAQYFFLKGNTYLDLAKKKLEEDKNLEAAAKSYAELLSVESKSGKSKFTPQVQTNLMEIKQIMTNSAVADNNNKKFKESAKKLYQVYMLDKKDTIMLYYAAATAQNGQDNDAALSYYNMLKQMNYSGKGKAYFAKSKLSDKEDSFNNPTEMKRAVDIGTHTASRTELIPSKKGEINKNISLIYIEKGDVPAAKKSITDARSLNPDDTSLIMAEADLYLKTEDYVTYKKLVTEVLAKNPRDADLLYNLGVISSKSKDGSAEAESYYKKAIEIDPNYKNAYMNLAVLKLEGEAKLIDQMNKLGTSAADEKKYQALRTKRLDMFRGALPYLEKAYQLFAGDADIKSTLKNVYSALDMMDKAKALK